MPLHSAAKRMHSSAYFWTLNSDIWPAAEMGRSGFFASEKNGISRIDPPQSIWCGSASDDVRLFGSLPYLMDLETTHRSGVGVFQFVRCERGDNSLLISSDQVRKCTGFDMKHDNLLRLVDSNVP